MGRGTEQAAQNMAAQNTALFTQQQQQALAMADDESAQNKKLIADLTAKNPWGDPTYQNNIKNLASTVAQGAANRAKGNLENQDLQTGGQNTKQYTAAAKQAKNQSELDKSAALTEQSNIDWNNYQDLRKFGAVALGDIPGLYQDIYGASSSGLTSTAQQLANVANKTQSNTAGSILGGAGSVLGAIAMICPCAGGLVTMFDMSESLVEELMQGELSLSVDGGHDKVTATPEPVEAECVRVTTQTGKKAEVSVSHTWIRPLGGYVPANECKGELVKTRDGAERVESVVSIGKRKVYPLVLDRTRSYQVNGIWSLS